MRVNRINPTRDRAVALCLHELLVIRAGVAPDVLWDYAEWACIYGFSRARHDGLMAHLREPVRLP